MTESDLGRELADIAGSLRRYVERERAAGTGELMARGAAAAAARRAGGPGPPEAARPEPPHAAGRPRGPGRDSGEDRTERDPARPGPSAAPESSEPAPSAAPPAAALSLFGEPEPEPDARVAAYALPPEPPLNPIEIGERVALQSLALPVLEEIAGQARACRKCGLCETRTQAVPGVGSATSGIVFVGEAPGADEDAQGEPFVGRAGQLLTQIIKAMDDKRLIPGVRLDRSTVYICNVLKCRPPENRNPLPHEIEMCSPYLRRQLEALGPRVICCLGKFAAELLVGVKGSIAGLRGKVYRYRGAKLIVTYHPAACLRNPGYKRPVWEDMQLLAREYLG